MSSGDIVTFAFGSVMVSHAERSTLHRGLDGLASWPCPGCAAERLLDDSWLAVVVDPDGENERSVLLCAGCAAKVGIPQRYG